MAIETSTRFDGDRLVVDVTDDKTKYTKKVSYKGDEAATVRRLEERLSSLENKPERLVAVVGDEKHLPRSAVDGSVVFVKGPLEVAVRSDGKWSKLPITHEAPPAQVVIQEEKVDLSSYATKAYVEKKVGEAVTQEEKSRWESYGEGVSFNGSPRSRDLRVTASTLPFDDRPGYTVAHVLESHARKDKVYTKEEIDAKFVYASETPTRTNVTFGGKAVYVVEKSGNVEANRDEETKTLLVDAVDEVLSAKGWVFDGAKKVALGYPIGYVSVEHGQLLLVSKSEYKRSSRNGKFRLVLEYTLGHSSAPQGEKSTLGVTDGETGSESNQTIG